MTSDVHRDSDGTPIELGQNPTLGESFAPISPSHERAIDDVEKTIDAFARGEQSVPPSIRGPFRTGKTSLQYHAFEYAWKEGLPAVFVEASTLLDEYDPTVEIPFDTWVYQRMQEEATAIVERNLDSIEWFPSMAGSEAARQEWIDSTVPEDVNTERGVLLIDEVEQEYTEFISATGVDDDNPLRKLLDRPEMATILSMGQLSAFEFVGDADLGRMEPISIPPVTVGHIEDLLVKHGADPSLGRVAYWLTRGRAARVHQVMTEASKLSLSPSDHSEVAGWLSDYAHQRSSEFQPVRQVWEDPEIDDPEAAAGALAFDPDGYPEWLIENKRWFAASDVVSAIEQVLIDAEPFTSTGHDTGDVQEARRILRQTIRWVVHGIAAPETAVEGDGGDRAIPVGWLTGMRMERAETVAFLCLVQDFLLAFEADRDARVIAFDALENAKESFRQRYDSEMATITARENEDPVSTVRPTVLETAFPPLATDPSRLTSHETSNLKEQMDQGLEVSVEGPATVYACPAQDAYVGQLEHLDADPTHPIVILVDEDIEIEGGLDSVPLAGALDDHDVLKVLSVPTARVWEFVVQLFGRLKESTDKPYKATDERVDQLVENSSNREVRTTIETLYGHFTQRIAAEAASAAVSEHRQQFAGNGELVWLNDDVAGKSWVNPRAGYSIGRNAGFNLLVLGAEPDWTKSHGNLMKTIESGLENDAIAEKSGFAYKELFRRVHESGGYGTPVQRPRNVCRNDSDTGPSEPVARFEGAFKSIIDASGFDRDEVLAALFEKEGLPGSEDREFEEVEAWVKSLYPVEEEKGLPNSDDVLWAVVTAGLACSDESYVVDTLQSVEDDLNDLRSTLKGYIGNIEAAEEVLAPEGTVTDGTGTADEIVRLSQTLESQINEESPEPDETVEASDVYGTGVELDASHIETYLDNITEVRDGIRDAKGVASNNADFRPTAYALAILGSRYEHVLRDAVDELDRGAPTDGDLNHVRNLRNEIEELTGFREEETTTEMSDELGEAVDSFAHDALDLQRIQQSIRISVGDPDGEGMDTIDTINRAALTRTYQVQELTKKFEKMNQLSDLVDQKRRDSRQSLRNLVQSLANPNQPIRMKNTSDGQTIADGEDNDEESETDDYTQSEEESQ